MNVTRQPNKSESGHTILIGILFSVVLGLTIASYLVLVRSQFISTARSHNWNAAVVLAEAGVEDALALINRNAGDFVNLTNWPATAAADFWTVDGNVFHAQRTPDAALGHYDVWVTNLVTSVAIYCEGTAHWDTSTSDTASLSNNVRRLLVHAGLQPLLPVAMGSAGNIDFNGNNVTVDSFDSKDPLHSNWITNSGYGTYTSGKRKAAGDVAANGDIFGAPGHDSARIYGTVYTRPGGYTNLQHNGSVGDTNWVKVSTDGIQPGHVRDDLNTVFANVSLPQATWSLIDPLTNNIVLNEEGRHYQIANNDGLNQNLTVTASNVSIHLVHGINYSGFFGTNHTLMITNGSLTIYAGGSITMDGSSAIKNTTSDAANLMIYGLTNLTSVTLGGTNVFIGSIYAPQADLTIGDNSGGGGGFGGSSYRFTGSAIGKSIKVNERLNFRYDENLRRVTNNIPARAYIATNWTEL